jgi:PPOX class probable F420-dependent enzyme
MQLDDARAFLREHHRSVLATRRAGGGPQLSPVVHGVDDDGRVLISSREPTYKVRNLRRDAQASLCAVPDAFFGHWIQIDGAAEIISLPEAMDLLIFIYRQVGGEHPDWDDYRSAMERERRVVIRITMERAGPDRAN